MAYNEYLQERINAVLNEKHIQFEARKMMGGLCYMVDHKMCLGIIKEDLMVRVGIDAYEMLLKRAHARPMDFTTRPMKGYIYVAPEGVDFEEDLAFWVQKALHFNPFAKASRKRRK